MFARFPRWFLPGLVLLAALLLVLQFQSGRTELPPDCVEANRVMTAGEHDLAIEHYFRCMETNELPNNVQAFVFYNLGNAYSAKDNHYQAVKDYSEAIELDPTNAWAFNNRCWSYGLLRQPSEALADCEEALRLLPDQPEILDSRALAYWQLGEHDKARADLGRAHAKSAEFPAPDERIREFEEMFP